MEGYHNVDVRRTVGPDQRVDLNEYPWPWPPDTYTHVLASHILEHLDDQAEALRELYRITASGGTITIRCPHWNSPSMAIDPTHRQPLDPRTLEHELAPDWTITNVEYTGVRGAQFLPDRLAVWLADMVGHFVIEWTATIHVPDTTAGGLDED